MVIRYDIINKILFAINIVLMVWQITYIISQNLDNSLSDYYHDQAEALCDIANSYRNLVITIKPELINEVSPNIDCDKYLEVNLV